MEEREKPKDKDQPSNPAENQGCAEGKGERGSGGTRSL